jgi:hypothetical protein
VALRDQGQDLLQDLAAPDLNCMREKRAATERDLSIYLREQLHGLECQVVLSHGGPCRSGLEKDVLVYCDHFRFDQFIQLDLAHFCKRTDRDEAERVRLHISKTTYLGAACRSRRRPQ